MSDHRVVWYEGIFMRPQHFQQQERFLERQAAERLAATVSCAWGFTELVIDDARRRMGRVAVTRAAGLFPDGTAFGWPDRDAAPPDFVVPADMRDEILFLALAIDRPGVPAFTLDGPAPEATPRYVAQVEAVPDAVQGFAEPADVHVGRLQLRWVRQRDLASVFVLMGTVGVVGRDERGVVRLDADYVPPMLDVARDPVLSGYVTELQGLFAQRAEALAAEMAGSGTLVTAELQDFLLLQVINRGAAVLDHFASMRLLHPQALYERLVGLAGELASYSQRRRLDVRFPPYDHDDLGRVFRPVMDALRAFLSIVLRRAAVPIPLEDRGRGAWLATLTDRSLLQGARFVLAVEADMNVDEIRTGMRQLVVAGPVERAKLIIARTARQEDRLEIESLAAKPTEIPFRPRTAYYEFDTTGAAWRGMSHSAGLLIFFAGTWPGLRLELWAIRFGGST